MTRPDPAAVAVPSRAAALGHTGNWLSRKSATFGETGRKIERVMADARPFMDEMSAARTAGFDRLHPSETAGRLVRRYRTHRIAHTYLDLVPATVAVAASTLDPHYLRIIQSESERRDRRFETCRTRSHPRVLIAAPRAPGRLADRRGAKSNPA